MRAVVRLRRKLGGQPGRCRLAESLGMQVGAAFRLGLVFLDRYAVVVRPRVLANAGDLPGDLLVGVCPGDREFVLRYLRLDVQIRGRLADRGELVTEVAIEGLEPLR